MAEDNWDVREKVQKSLADLTASQYLLLYSDEYNLMSDITANPFEKTLSGGLTLAPRDDSLPSARLSAEGGVNQRPSAALSLSIPVGRQLIDYERRFEKGSTTDTVFGEAGPFSAFYSKINPTNNQYPQETNLGGTMNIGPAELFARRTRSRQEVVDPRYARFFPNPHQDTQEDTIGAHGSLPLGPGMVSGGVDRQFVTSRYPQHISQDARPVYQDPNVTNYRLGWEGPVGPGRLGLQGTLRHVRDVGMEPSLSGLYTIPNPLGLGGQFRATSSYVNPIDGESAAEAMLGYKLRF